MTPSTVGRGLAPAASFFFTPLAERKALLSVIQRAAKPPSE